MTGTPIRIRLGYGYDQVNTALIAIRAQYLFKIVVDSNSMDSMRDLPVSVYRSKIRL